MASMCYFFWVEIHLYLQIIITHSRTIRTNSRIIYNNNNLLFYQQLNECSSLAFKKFTHLSVSLYIVCFAFYVLFLLLLFFLFCFLSMKFLAVNCIFCSTFNIKLLVNIFLLFLCPCAHQSPHIRLPMLVMWVECIFYMHCKIIHLFTV